ncbi:alpha/beta fold hydrolase [Hoeflea sp. TYP-13]|uniref:alpha/beta fold hydrolase n=1 Tax=Hoeflea sp. TYP-13 TaxID=3230023 RepID=UPI0034C617CD
MAIQRKSATTNDGVTISYLEGGSGRPLVMLPGWSQTASGFSAQIEAFCRIRKVIALDQRGHGESGKAQNGYRIFRLAKDLHDVITTLDIEDFDFLGHSLGVSVIFAYLMLFQNERPPQRLVLADEPPALLARPDWTDTERENAGSVLASLQDVADFKSAIRSADTPALHAEILRPMFTASIDENKLLEIAAENLKLPRNHAADLLENNCLQDWRSFILTIRLPTLVVAGEASPHPISSLVWITEQIAGARLELIPKSEGGSHFMFMENPGRFNSAVVDFLSAA